MKPKLDLKVYNSLHGFVLDIRELALLRRAFVNGIANSEQIIGTEKRSQVFRPEGWIAM